jgi:hypothetical protein
VAFTVFKAGGYRLLLWTAQQVQEGPRAHMGKGQLQCWELLPQPTRHPPIHTHLQILDARSLSLTKVS